MHTFDNSAFFLELVPQKKSFGDNWVIGSKMPFVS